MKIEEAIAYVNHYSWNKTRPGLSRTKELLEKMGNPQKKLKFVHVAGSNGKGSTCAMLESILRTAGYKTGFYLSPYIEDFKETFQICGKMIGDDEFCRITEKVKYIAENMADHPSQFEIKTAIAFQYFADNACDMVVLETGMGGEFDSTNVIDAPVVAVITNIGLEHTEFLGDTLEKIAATKAEGEEQARYFHDVVTVAMAELRDPVDKLEMIVDKEMWPMPSYGDLLFEV